VCLLNVKKPFARLISATSACSAPALATIGRCVLLPYGTDKFIHYGVAVCENSSVPRVRFTIQGFDHSSVHLSVVVQAMRMARELLASASRILGSAAAKSRKIRSSWPCS
jgi:hypothetical protein